MISKSKFKVGDIIKLKSEHWFSENIEPYLSSFLRKKNSKLIIEKILAKNLKEKEFEIVAIWRNNYLQAPFLNFKIKDMPILDSIYEAFVERADKKALEAKQ